MTAWTLLRLLIYFVGFLNSLFFSGFYLIQNRDRNRANRWLGLLLLLFAFRLFKALFIQFYPGLHTLYHVIWFGAMACMGPLFVSYVNALTQTHGRRLTWQHLPPLLFTTGCALFPQWMTIAWLYRVLTLYMLSYLLAGLFRLWHFRRHHRLNAWESRWFRGLSLFFEAEFLLFGIAMSRVIRLDLPGIESILLLISLYLLAYLELRHKITHRVHDRTTGDQPMDDRLEQRLTALMETERLYLDAGLSLAVLAGRAGVSAHRLSRHLNQCHLLPFNDYINRYRIEAAKQRLLDPAERHKTIATLAMECGFNSLSVFNPAFKKWTGLTPSAYQKKHQSH